MIHSDRFGNFCQCLGGFVFRFFALVCNLGDLWSPLIAIFCGFMASGISRTRSMISRPSSRAALSTRTKSASSKATFKIAVGNSHVQKLFSVIVVVILVSGDQQQVLLGSDFDLVFLESGHCKGDPVMVIAAAFDIERGIIFGLLGPGVVFKQIEQAVKADS